MTIVTENLPESAYYVVTFVRQGESGVMKSKNEIELQISRLGMKNRFWGRPEIRELQRILSGEEIITNAVNGHYEGGFALLVSTDQRLLLVDKKLWFLSMEDIRYDMISEVDYCSRLLDSTISVVTINKILRFTAIRKRNLRSLTTYIQDKIIELRSQQSLQLPRQQFAMQQPEVIPAQQYMQAVVSPPPATISVPMRPFRRIGAYPVTALTSQQTTFSRPELV